MIDCSTELVQSLQSARKALGIDMRYKLDDTLDSMPLSLNMSPEGMEKYLRGKSVSPKEIKASGILDLGVDTPMSGKDWKKLLDKSGNPHHVTTSVGNGEYDYVSLYKQGEYLPTKYSEELLTVNTPKEGGYPPTHFKPEVKNLSKYKNPDGLMRAQKGDSPKTIKETEELSKVSSEIIDELEELLMVVEYPADAFDNIVIKELTARRDKLMDSIYKARGGKVEQSLLGWIRTHTDTLNGKISTVLNELQSDWAQFQRSGAGLFKKNVLSDSAKAKLKGDDLELYNALEGRGRAGEFPMSPAKFQQVQVVKAIDQAIKTGTNRVVIPMERANELYGSEGVTSAYKMLHPSKEEGVKFVKNQELAAWSKKHPDGNMDAQKQILDNSEIMAKKVEGYINKTVLPTVRKKLGAQGLEIKLSKEKIKGERVAESIMAYIEKNVVDQKALAEFKIKHPQFNLKESEDIFEYTGFKVIEALKKGGIKLPKGMTYDKLLENNNYLHILDIVPNNKKPVKYNYYEILGTLGIGGGAATAANQDTSATAQIREGL